MAKNDIPVLLLIGRAQNQEKDQHMVSETMCPPPGKCGQEHHYGMAQAICWCAPFVLDLAIDPTDWQPLAWTARIGHRHAHH